MKKTLITLTLASTLALAACGADADSGEETTTTTTSTVTSTVPGPGPHTGHGEMHQHATEGGQAPAGIAEAQSPTYPVGTEVIVNAAHMPGMDGATATIVGAFDTTTYAVSFTPTDGGAPLHDHRWVVHEELVDAPPAPLPVGTEVTLGAGHMSGMMGAVATIDSATGETVYMIDINGGDMPMRNHKWVTESELSPVS